MSGWLWIVIMAVPAFVWGWKGRNFQAAADAHRRPDAPPHKPRWEPEDMFRPRIYTPEGNKLRQKALLYVYVYPLGWWAAVLSVGYLITSWS